MGSHVGIQATPAGKRFLTQLAFVWHFSSMSSQFTNQKTTNNKRFLAYLACVWMSISIWLSCDGLGYYWGHTLFDIAGICKLFLQFGSSLNFSRCYSHQEGLESFYVRFFPRVLLFVRLLWREQHGNDFWLKAHVLAILQYEFPWLTLQMTSGETTVNLLLLY